MHLNRHLPAPPIRAGLTVGSLPDLLPLIAWRGTRRAHVVVLADRVGAEVCAYSASDIPPVSDVSADTAEWPVHKTGVGGWATKRFDATVEESWARSAKRVAGLVEEAAHLVNPAVVIGSGDEHAISLLQEQLPERLRSEFVVVQGGGRHADGSGDLVARRVDEAVAQQIAIEEQHVLAQYAEAAGRAKGAASGMRDVISAIQQAQVETLIVTDAIAGSDNALGFGPDPIELAVSKAAMAELGIAEASSGAAVDVLLRAAIGSGADVLVVDRHAPGAPAKGVGAVLRFDPAAAPA